MDWELSCYSFEVTPIGVFYGDATYKQDAPRQGRLFADHLGKIELAKGKNFETALRDLDGFERIWVIFQFHKNKEWRPTTRPPVPALGRDRVGTFASRSPYRPNPIGLSCVRLLKIEGVTLYVDEADLLNGTPVLDIKPYIPMADAFPNAKAGWVEEQDKNVWSVEASEEFSLQNQFLLENMGFNIFSFAVIQLAQGPYDTTRKRITLLKNAGILAYRTFRVEFEFNETTRKIFLNKIRSGYTEEELKSDLDPYGDKETHRKLNIRFFP
ncbi:MAG: tRNA (N6-threonylcarbamoyladenosine(37)-N6)-methyltransferase TrmO [Fibrobacteraceae bacterium]|nr:tRNA (N6-threonylcarbamoyladenosine(37)-N6)-methyltransferase TrmO [Fibrobacteraceae bacterium]